MTNNLMGAIEQWLASHETATDQAIRGEQLGHEPNRAFQNKDELAALVASTRASAILAVENAERRCASEIQGCVAGGFYNLP